MSRRTALGQTYQPMHWFPAQEARDALSYRTTQGVQEVSPPLKGLSRAEQEVQRCWWSPTGTNITLTN